MSDRTGTGMSAVGGAPVGRVVVLNGASSSGKSSIARALRAGGAPWFWLASDHFWAMLPPRPGPEAEVPQRLAASEAFLQSALLVARRGWDVVVDAVITHPLFRRRTVELMAGLPAYFVGVRCSPEELERREVARGDRKPGLALWQAERVHAGLVYDLELDTTAASPEACARRIEQRVAAGAGPQAFASLLVEARSESTSSAGE